MNGYRRAWSYCLLTAALLAMSSPLQVACATVEGFSRALSWLLAAGVIMLGVGLFLRRGSDALFFDMVGGFTLLLALVFFLLYGGMEELTAPGTVTAINLLLCLWTALPLAFWGRTVVLGYSAAASRGRRHPVAWAAMLLLAVMILLLATGNLLPLTNTKALMAAA